MHLTPIEDRATVNCCASYSKPTCVIGGSISEKNVYFKTLTNKSEHTRCTLTMECHAIVDYTCPRCDI